MAEAKGPPASGGPRGRLRPDSIAMTTLLTVLVAYGALSNNMVLPALPALASVFQVPGGVAMLVIPAFFLGFGTGQLFFGSLSDRFGRRPVLLMGLGLYTLATAACIMAPDMETLMIIRVIQGIAAAPTQVLARAIVRDYFAPAGAAKMLSVMSAALAIASALAPLAGGLLLAWFGWQAIFAALAMIGGVTLLLVWFGLAESLPRLDPEAINPGRIAANYNNLARNRIFSGYTLTFAVAFGAMYAFHAGSAFVFIDLLGFGPEIYGLFLAFVLSGYFLGTVISARVTVRIGFRRLVAAGIMISVIGAGAMLALVLGGHTSVLTILIPQFIFMLGFGLVFPNAIAGALAPFPEKAGAASALLGFTQQSAGAIMVTLLGALATGSAVPMAACIFAGAVISVACFVLIVPKPAAAGDTTENR